MTTLEELFDNAGPAPKANRIPTTLSHFSDQRIDEYYWLKDKDSPEVIQLLKEENLYCEKVMGPLTQLKEELFHEIKSRIKETDLSVPVRHKNYFYSTKTEEGLQYPIHIRKRQGSDREEILLDENMEAQNNQFFALGGLYVSPDEELVAYLIDNNGSELYSLTVRSIAKPEIVVATLDDCYYGLAWSLDSKSIYYTKTDDQMRPYQIWKLNLETCASEVIFQEDDEGFYIGIGTTKDEKFIVIECGSKTTTQSFIIDAADSNAKPMPFTDRVKDLEYSVEHHGDSFFVVSNRDNPNFSLMRVDQNIHDHRAWVPYLESEQDVRLLGIEVFTRYLALLERQNAVTRLRVVDLETKEIYEIEKGEEVSTIYIGDNEEFESEILRYEYTSMITPRSVFEINMKSREITLLKRSEVLGTFSSSNYKTIRVWANADDGSKIPVSLLCRSDVSPSSSGHPVVIYGYGSYEHSIDPTFSSMRLSLVDRGVVFAIAHVRGGGELGRNWYLDGKFDKKPNTFTDFITATQSLIDLGWADPNRIAARGGSAGGMLMGAVANLAAEKYKAIVAEVPFVDCLTTILDPSLPLTIFEWEEWGNPVEDQNIYNTMKSYSPYDNVTNQQYPMILVTAGLNDPRVSYWEPAKWVHKLRSTSNNARVILKTEMEAGHQGPSGRYEIWNDEAFVYAFLLSALELA
jgi:oligopeptidase B